MITNSVRRECRRATARGPGRSSFRPQVGHADVLVGVVSHQPTVLVHTGVAFVDDIHAVLVAHREAVLVHYRLEVGEHRRAFLKQLGVTHGYGAQFLRREIRVGEHTLEVVHIDVGDLADHEDGLLHLAGVAEQVLTF